MPDSFEHMAPVAIRIPNGALASLAGNVDRHHRVAIADLILVQGRVGPTIARLMQELEPDVVGLSVMTFQRATALKVAAAGSPAAAGRAHRRRRLRSEPRARRLRARARRSTSSCAAKASTRSGSCCGRWNQAARSEPIAGLSYRCGARVRAQPQSPGRVAEVGRTPAARPRRARARRLHAARPAGRRRRDVAGLHVRLQLLLDHRDARPELPPVSDRSGARRHRRRAPPRRARDLPGRRQHHARRAPVRGALPGDRRQRA